MRINTNLTALNTYTQYSSNTSKVSSAVSKLSSGYAINSAADNAAGLAISEKMRAQIRGLNQASSNTQDAVSLVQTAEGALSSSTTILQRMREIAVQSSSDTNNDSVDRDSLQDEFSQLQSELDDISSSTTFNKKNLLDGSISTSKDSISSLSLANTSLGVSLGNVKAGSYTFNCQVKMVSTTITGHVASATNSFTSSSYNFVDKTVAATTSLTGTAASGSTSLSSQYNGNYTLSAASNSDGSITVTATGDNDQTFTATISAASLSAGFAASSSIGLNFGSNAFTTTLTLGSQAYTDSDSAKTQLCSDISGVGLSISGGIDHKDATYAAYATINGGEDIKLAAGDTSVSFSNGVTVGFDELSSTDLTVTNGTLTSGLVTKFGSAATTTANSISAGTSFTIDKTANAGLTFQVGANEGDEMTINVDRMDSQYLGVSSSKVSTQTAASSAITAVDDAINQVSSQRATLGAVQNRLDYKNDNLETANENLTSAESQIRDVDMAKEMTTFTNSNILLQASTAMLAQANSLPQNVLSLIK